LSLKKKTTMPVYLKGWFAWYWRWYLSTPYGNRLDSLLSMALIMILCIDEWKHIFFISSRNTKKRTYRNHDLLICLLKQKEKKTTKESYHCFFFPWICSRKSPRKTSIVPRIWRSERIFPNNNTEQSIVKNFRVVVKIEHVNGPNHSIVKKIKFY